MLHSVSEINILDDVNTSYWIINTVGGIFNENKEDLRLELEKGLKHEGSNQLMQKNHNS